MWDRERFQRFELPYGEEDVVEWWSDPGHDYVIVQRETASVMRRIRHGRFAKRWTWYDYRWYEAYVMLDGDDARHVSSGHMIPTPFRRQSCIKIQATDGENILLGFSTKELVPAKRFPHFTASFFLHQCRHAIKKMAAAVELLKVYGIHAPLDSGQLYRKGIHGPSWHVSEYHRACREMGITYQTNTLRLDY